MDRCEACPVPAEVPCYAQRTRAAHAYCRPIAAGDRHKAALVVDLSCPPAETAGLELVMANVPALLQAFAEGAPKPGDCGCGKA